MQSARLTVNLRFSFKMSFVYVEEGKFGKICVLLLRFTSRREDFVKISPAFRPEAMTMKLKTMKSQRRRLP